MTECEVLNQILTDNRQFTSKLLSRELGVHSAKAVELMNAFYSKHPKLTANYVIIGVRDGVHTVKITADVEQDKQQFEHVESVTLYALSSGLDINTFLPDVLTELQQYPLTSETLDLYGLVRGPEVRHASAPGTASAETSAIRAKTSAIEAKTSTSRPSKPTQQAPAAKSSKQKALESMFDDLDEEGAASEPAPQPAQKEDRKELEDIFNDSFSQSSGAGKSQQQPEPAPEPAAAPSGPPQAPQPVKKVYDEDGYLITTIEKPKPAKSHAKSATPDTKVVKKQKSASGAAKPVQKQSSIASFFGKKKK